MSYLYPAIGAAIALAGLDKLVGLRGYERMFGHLAWTEGQIRTLAAAEMAGGLMMAPTATRRLGGTIVTAASLAMMTSELKHGDAKLALPRGLVLLAGLSAMAGARQTSDRSRASDAWTDPPRP